MLQNGKETPVSKHSIPANHIFNPTTANTSSEFEPLAAEFVKLRHRPGQLFLQLLGVLVALVKETGLSLHELRQAAHVVRLEKQQHVQNMSWCNDEVIQ